MRYWKLFVATLMAVCALGAAMAIAASALPTILPETVKTFTGKNIGGLQWTTVGGETVSCKEAIDLEGTIEQPKPLGLFHIHVKKCTSLGGLVTCTGLGEETGVILALGSWHLVYDTLKASLSEAGVAILFLPGNVHFECAGVLLVMKLGGMILCLILNPTGLTKVFEFHCKERSGGGPEETKYYNAAGALTSIVPLEISENEGAGKATTMIWLGTIEFPEATLLMI